MVRLRSLIGGVAASSAEAIAGSGGVVDIHGRVLCTRVVHEPVLELTALPEVEGGARQALLQDLHHRDEHLRGDLRVELDVLVQAELRDLLESLTDEILDFPLLLRSLLLVHGTMHRALPIIAALFAW